MTNVILISEDWIKTNSNLNDQFWAKNLRNPIREAQEIGLQTVIGECLYNKIIDLVKTGEITADENAAYKDLLDNYIRDYLLYLVLSNSVLTSNVKLANIGTTISNDEHIVNLSQAEAELLRNNYENKSDFYKKRMQNFILNNLAAFPEIEECNCNCHYVIKPNLKSSSSTGIYLGGDYGKRI